MKAYASIVLALTLLTLAKPSWAYKKETHAFLAKRANELQFAHAERVYAQGNDAWGNRLTQAAEMYKAIMPALQQAVQDAYEPRVWRQYSLLVSLNHGWNPQTGKGWTSASKGAIYVALYFEIMAAEAWRRGNTVEALRFLGFVLHLHQDLFVPHHAACNPPTDSHALYEAACVGYHGLITLDLGVISTLAGTPENQMAVTSIEPWIRWAALDSIGDYAAIRGRDRRSQSQYKAVAVPLMHDTIRYTAGYLFRFYERFIGGTSAAAITQGTQTRARIPSYFFEALLPRRRTHFA